MVDLIRPKDLPPSSEIPADTAIPIDTGVEVVRATPKQIADIGRPISTQAQAIAGTDNTTAMTPLTTAQAMDNRLPGIIGNILQPYVDQAQAWAESPNQPDPEDPDSKSAKTWAEQAREAAEALGDAVGFEQKTFVSVAGQLRYTVDVNGDPLDAMEGFSRLSGSAPFGSLVYGDDYTISDFGYNLTADPGNDRLFFSESFPRTSNTEAMTILQQIGDYTDANAERSEAAADRAEDASNKAPQSWADFQDAKFLALQDGAVVQFNGVSFRRRRSANVLGLSSGAGWQQYGTMTVLHFGAAGDCTGPGLGTDDSLAFTRALNWLKGGAYRRVEAPAGYRWRIANPVMPVVTQVVGAQFVMYSPITPDAKAMTAISLYSIRDGLVRLMVSGGGQDADYSQPNPVGMSQAFDIRGCRRMHGEVLSRSYLGRALRVSKGGVYKMSFLHFSLDAGDNVPSLDAVPTGQGFYIDAEQSACGGFHYANTAWTKYGSVVESAVDFTLGHWEMGSTHSANEFRGCGSIWLGHVLGGDETQTQTLLRFTTNAVGGTCNRVDIQMMQGVQALCAIDLDAMNPNDAGVTIHNLVTNGCITAIKANGGSVVRILNHDSQGDRYPLQVTGNHKLLEYNAAARISRREVVTINTGVTGVYLIKGHSDSPSQEAAGVHAHIKIDSTAARPQLVDLVLEGTAKACVEAVSGASYSIQGGRFTTSTKFIGEEPNSIDHVQGIDNNRLFTATIPSGQTSVTVAHGLFNTPSHILCSGRTAETASAFAQSWDATNVTIAVPVATTAARAVDVQAARRP